MFTFDYIKKEDIKKHNPNWRKTPDQLYWIILIGGSVSGKTNVLLNPYLGGLFRGSFWVGGWGNYPPPLSKTC